MPKSNKLFAYLKLTSVILIWGGVYHSAKYLVSNTDIYTVSFIRFLIASIVLLGLYYNKYGYLGFKKSKKHWLMLMAIGFFGIYIYNVLFFSAESLISANNVAILYAFTPCLTVTLSVIFLKQRINLVGVIGVVVALLGTIGVISLSDPSCGKVFCQGLFSHLSLGQALAILAMVCMSCFNILNKKAALMKIDSLSITTFGAIFGTIILFLNFLIMGDKVVLLLHKSWGFWLAMLYTAVFATVIAYKWYTDAIHEIGVGPTAVFQNGVPFSAILISLIIMRQGIEWKILLSGSVIVIGVLITNLAVNRR